MLLVNSRRIDRCKRAGWTTSRITPSSEEGSPWRTQSTAWPPRSTRQTTCTFRRADSRFRRADSSPLLFFLCCAIISRQGDFGSEKASRKKGRPHPTAGKAISSIHTRVQCSRTTAPLHPRSREKEKDLSILRFSRARLFSWAQRAIERARE